MCRARDRCWPRSWSRAARRPSARATLVLTATFAIGTALPLLVFALAGRRVAGRVGAFRRRQRIIQIVGGITMIVLAVALVFNLPAMLQRAVPDYTAAMQKAIGRQQNPATKLERWAAAAVSREPTRRLHRRR